MSLVSSAKKAGFAEGENLGLQPGIVRSVDKPHIVVEVQGQRLKAINAISHFYQPVVGDQLLVADSVTGVYLLGVIEGKGNVNLVSQGDMSLNAAKGTLYLEAGTAVSIRAPSLTQVADVFKLKATQAFHRFGQVDEMVEGAFRFAAGKLQSTIEGLYRLRAKEVNTRARGEVKIDGDQIKLG